MSSLGYLDIDRQSETFSAAAMNPLGLKLYEISGSRDGVTTHFMIEPLKRDGVFADAVAQDIMRLYFDLIPPESAEIGKKDSRITFRSRFGAGVLLHTFSEIEGNLVEKKYFEANRLNWRVLYSEYRHRDGTVYPGRIVLHNYRDGYRIDVKVKDMVL
jgi:outer membrane biogenesis lipoprotein LolB